MRWLSLMLLLTACSRGPEPGEELILQGFRPLEGQRILLNEPLELTFSRDVDPSSITPSNLWVEDHQGRRCAGQWRVKSTRMLLFWPRTVLDSNLSSGGYRPGRPHLVRVVGFPAVGGLRAQDGEPLNRSYRLPFDVVDPAPTDRAFLDFSPYGCKPLVVGLHPSGLRAPVQEDEPIRLWCLEPLDPRSLHSEDFSIWYHDPWNPNPEQSTATKFSDVRVSMVQNRHSELLLQNQGACELECTPETRLDPSRNGRFSLRVHRNARLKDYNGYSPWPAASPSGPRFEFYFRVEPVDAQGQRRLRLDFLDREHLSSQRIPWVDGELRLQPGRLTVPMPTCAGLGGDGELTLEGSVDFRDSHGVQIRVPQGKVAVLSSKPGPVVLRSQGAWNQLGRLERVTGGSWESTPSQWVAEHPGASVDDLLKYAEQANCNWTVLIAGGDLILKGDIEVDTPVLLVAGGRVRSEARLNSPVGELYKVGEGGGSGNTQPMRTLNLVMPEPGINPLRIKQRYALVTSSLPRWVADRYEWEHLKVGAHDGSGRTEVLFLPHKGPVELDRCMTHPRALPPNEPLRVLILMTVEPGGSWDPPTVDFIHLSWRVQ
ncbi:MAG: hypothetical protein GY930_13200 [bacterium]|nr:hypothetical protein [bacterium]